MNTAFIIAALVAVLIALAFILAPLSRTGPEVRALRRRYRALEALADELEPDDYRQRRERIEADMASQPGQTAGTGLMIGLLLAVPLATWLLYQQVGEPAGLEAEEPRAQQMREALIDLARSLERDPDNLENWTRLGLFYRDLGEFSSAEHALRRALYLDDGNGFIQVELAETLLYASQNPRLPAESRALLESAAEREPDNQKALWLLGIGAFQDSDYQTALRWWQQLESQLPEGSVRDSVSEQIQRAEARLAQPEAGALPPGHPPIVEPGTDSQPHFRVSVDIDPSLRENLTGSETVFLVARAAEGPAAPLAVRRLMVNDLPLDVALSDADAMVEGLEISNFPELILTARVSFSGDAQARDGDYEGQAGPVSIHEVASAAVLIDRVVNRSTD